MFNNDILKDVLVYIITYLPPLVMFIKFSREKGRSRILLFFISIIYIVLSLFTENLLPFIFVILNILYIKKADNNRPVWNYYYTEINDDYFNSEIDETFSSRFAGDYERYGFTMKNFSLLKAVKFAVISYVITILISSISLLMFSSFKIDLKEQPVVTWMVNLPLTEFLIIIPVAVIFAPVLEEFVFRWLFFEKIFRKRLGVYLAAIISSLIFGLIHYNVKAFPILFFIGMYNCFLIHRKGYWYSVLNHSAFNSITVFLLLLSKMGIVTI